MIPRPRLRPCSLVAASAVALLLTGCGDGIGLSIDVRTDLVVNAEFVALSMTLVGEEAPLTLPAEGDFLRGVRIADLADLSRNSERRLRIQLLDGAGAVVAAREVLIDHQVDRALTVSLSRDCRNAMCPGAAVATATACFGGRCVDPTCVDGTEASCPEAECTSDAQCPTLDPCSRPRCFETVCLYEPNPGACDDGFYCAPESGCLPLPTPVEPDAGVDADMDAGMLDVPEITWPPNGLSVRTGATMSLHWTEAAGAEAYELELDGSCEVDQRIACPFESAESVTVTTTESLLTALPSARYRVRVRACRDAICQAWSGTRYFDLGRSGGSDFNGDGVDELLVGSREHATLFEYDGANFDAVREIDSPFTDTTASFGIDSFVGDINADGFADVVFSAESNAGFGAVAIYYGSATGLSATAQIIDRPAESPINGRWSRKLCLSDFDGDGFADLGVASSSTSYIYLGSAAGIVDAVVASRTGTLTACADVNHDGLSDLVAGRRIYFGQPGSIVAEASIEADLFIEVALGDTNRDGYMDVAGGTAEARVKYGQPGGLAPASLVNSDGGSDPFDVQAISTADLNNDGYADAVFGDPQMDSGFPGIVARSMGGPSGLSPAANLSVPCQNACSRRGLAVSWGFDLNGDGFGDAAVGANDEEGVFVYFGSNTGIPDNPAVRVNRSDVRFANFGSSL